MTVHMAGNLPKDELNGLARIERRLIDGHLQGDKHLVIGVVKVSGTKALESEGFRPNPIVTFDHIEAVPDELHDVALTLLHDVLGMRTGASTLKFPGEEPEPPAPLELEASDGVYRFAVVDEPKAKFTLRVLAPSGAVAVERHALPRKVYGDVAPGEYLQTELGNEELIGLAGDLVRDYEQGFSEDLIDAEVVEDEPEGDE